MDIHSGRNFPGYPMGWSEVSARGELKLGVDMPINMRPRSVEELLLFPSLFSSAQLA
jgi:hypothetical protein